MDRPSNPRQAHKTLVEEAGIGQISFISILAGLVSAYGAFAIIAAIVGTILTRADVKTEFRTNDWTSSGGVAALGTAVTLLLAYLFGGYVAGRMARRAGVLHGIGVAVASLIIGGLAGGLVSLIADADDTKDIRRNLRSIGVPTNSDQITKVALVGALVSLAAILVGAILGGLLGERWHTKLARRAADPSVGPDADAQAEAQAEAESRREEHAREERDRLERDRREAEERAERAAVPVADTSALGDRGGDDADTTMRPDQDPMDLTDQDQRVGTVDRTVVAGQDLGGNDRSVGGRDGVGGAEPRYTAAEWQALQQDDDR